MARRTFPRFIFQLLISVALAGALLGGPVILMILVERSY